MSVQITIIGLGQIGASIGLALADQEKTLVRVGHDIDPGVMRQAKQMGAVDRVSVNLYRAVGGADLVLLALPLDQVKETLELVGGDLRENAVVMDTAPVKAAVVRWAEKYLPSGRHYVGLMPMINPHYLHGVETGIAGARADLFQDGLMAVVPPPGAEAAAVQMAIDLTGLLGATPLFADLTEVDSFVAATHTLPQLMAAALLGTTVDHPGWQDGRKFAGRAYAQVTSSLTFMDTPAAMASACLQNRDNMARVLDQLIASLQNLRATLASQQEQALIEQLTHDLEARQRWWQERLAAEWGPGEGPEAKAPPASSMLRRMLFGERPSERRRRKP